MPEPQVEVGVGVWEREYHPELNEKYRAIPSISDPVTHFRILRFRH